jgi:hypothetical protein
MLMEYQPIFSFKLFRHGSFYYGRNSAGHYCIDRWRAGAGAPEGSEKRGSEEVLGNGY